jgi:hypothetical protein
MKSQDTTPAKPRIGKIIKALLPEYSRRLVSDALPAKLPPDLHEDLRGMWLLEHYGPSDMRDFIEETLAHEAKVGGMGIGPDWLGFIDDYYRIAQYASGLELRTVIVDVGCGAGLQQVFFRDFAGYIGIDQWLPDCVKPINSNARFIEGNFAELVSSGKFVIEENMFGIANMSLLYQAGNEASVQAFRRFPRLIMA